MTPEQLRASLHQPQPPAALPPLLAALWWEAKGDWNQAHEIAQAENRPDAAWVHAYLTARKAMTQMHRTGTIRRAALHLAARKRMGADRLRPADPVSVRSQVKSGIECTRWRRNLPVEPIQFASLEIERNER